MPLFHVTDSCKKQYIFEKKDSNFELSNKF